MKFNEYIEMLLVESEIEKFNSKEAVEQLDKGNKVSFLDRPGYWIFKLTSKIPTLEGIQSPYKMMKGKREVGWYTKEDIIKMFDVYTFTLKNEK